MILTLDMITPEEHLKFSKEGIEEIRQENCSLQLKLKSMDDIIRQLQEVLQEEDCKKETLEAIRQVTEIWKEAREKLAADASQR